MTTLSPNVATPKLVIPTGFEAQQQHLQNRMALAKALKERALAGTSTNATSWTQVLAPIVDGLLAGRQQKGIDSEQAALAAAIQGQYGDLTGKFSEDQKAVDAGTMSIDDLVNKYRSNPMAAGWTDPYVKGQGTREEHRQTYKPEVIMGPSGRPEDVQINGLGQQKPLSYHIPKMVNNDGVAVDMNAVGNGEALNSPNADVWVDQNGATKPNMVKALVGAIKTGTGNPNGINITPEQQMEYSSLRPQPTAGVQAASQNIPMAQLLANAQNGGELSPVNAQGVNPPMAPQAPVDPNNPPMGTVISNPQTGERRILTPQGWQPYQGQ